MRDCMWCPFSGPTKKTVFLSVRKEANCAETSVHVRGLCGFYETHGGKVWKGLYDLAWHVNWLVN